LWPIDAKHAAETDPTYPKPKMLTDKPTQVLLIILRAAAPFELYQLGTNRPGKPGFATAVYDRPEKANIFIFNALDDLPSIVAEVHRVGAQEMSGAHPTVITAVPAIVGTSHLRM
jgi:hypothetical protein